MKQQKFFPHNQDPRKVLLNPEKVRQLKQELKFQPKSEYYLKLPQQAYQPFILFCLTATKDSLRNNPKNILKKLKKGFRKEVEEYYLKKNQDRQQFNGPQQLEELSNSANNYQIMFKQCHTDFKYKLIVNILDLFKKKFKVEVLNQQQKHIVSEQKSENVQELIYFVKQSKSIILCAFSSKPKLIAKIEQTCPIEFKTENQNLKKGIQKDNKKELEKHKENQEFIQNKSQIKKKPEKESKLNCSFTVFLVFILVVIIYISFAEIDPSFFKRNRSLKKSILEYLIQFFDSVSGFVF